MSYSESALKIELENIDFVEKNFSSKIYPYSTSGPFHITFPCGPPQVSFRQKIFSTKSMFSDSVFNADFEYDISFAWKLNFHG
jgi:hypothetical protein